MIKFSRSYFVLQEPTPPVPSAAVDQSSEITLTELNENEIVRSQKESKPAAAPGSPVKRRKVSRTEKEKVSAFHVHGVLCC